MKTNKWLYFIITAVIVAMFAACKDDNHEDEPEPPVSETPEVKESIVQFEYGKMTAERRDGRVLVPYVVHSDNDSVKIVNFKIYAYDTSHVDYFLDDPVYTREQSVYVMPGKDKGELEFSIDFSEFKEWNFTYIVRMESASGAKIGRINACIVSVRSKEEDIYMKLCAYEYAMTFTDMDGKEYHADNVWFGSPDYFDPLYRKMLILHGEGEFDLLDLNLDLPVKFISDEVKQGVSLELVGGGVIVENLQFGNISLGNGMSAYLGKCNLVSGFKDENGKLSEKGFLPGSWSDDLREITFDGTMYVLVKTTPDNDGHFGPNVVVATLNQWSNIRLNAVGEAIY